MKKVVFSILLLCICLLFCSCAEKQSQSNFYSMDTTVSIKVYGQKQKADESLFAAKNKVKELNKIFDYYSPDSDVTKFNNGTESLSLSKDFNTLFDFSVNICNQTDAFFSHTLGKAIDIWSEAEKTNTIPDEITLKNAANAGIIHFGAIAKGYACTEAIKTLKEHNIESGMVSMVSSVGVFGKKPDNTEWKIAIRSPFDNSEILGYVTLENEYLSVSGDYERYYEIKEEKYNHILCPSDGKPVSNGVHSVIVISKDGQTSDALSTAFFVAGIEKTKQMLERFEDIGVMIITDNETFMNEKMVKSFKYTK